MLDFSFILKGLIIGFSIAAPVGPIGVLCIRRTLAEGRAYGLASGLGAATADGFYGTLAALGLTLLYVGTTLAYAPPGFAGCTRTGPTLRQDNGSRCVCERENGPAQASDGRPMGRGNGPMLNAMLRFP